MSIFDGPQITPQQSAEAQQTAEARNNYQSPSDIYAEITREWWADQQTRFQPLEQMANDMILDPTRRNEIWQEGLDATSNAVENSFERGANRLETLRSRTNQVQSARGKKSSDRLNSLAKTTTSITARNKAREVLADTEMRVLSGTGTNPGS